MKRTEGRSGREAKGRGRLLAFVVGPTALAAAMMLGLMEPAPLRPAHPRHGASFATSTVASADAHDVPMKDPSGAPEDPSAEAPPAAVTVPDAETMSRYAASVARERWGEGAQLVESRAQLGGGGRPRTYLFLFSVGGPIESKEEILAELANGTDPVKWDERVRCFEMGARADLPPVVCFWNGLPPEYLERHRAEEKLKTEFGDRRFELVASHLSAAFPVLEFRAGDESFFYQPSSGRTGREFGLREREGYGTDERSQKRIARSHVLWQHFLDRMQQ